MTTNIVNQVAYLRTSREFPKETEKLVIECGKSYLDTSNAINVRTIGIFPINLAAIGGETWYLSKALKQQNLRQVYLFFTAPTTIPHGLNLEFVDRFTKCSGSYTDGTNWYGVIFGSSVAIPGQLSFYITPTDIVVLVGAGAPVIDPVKGGTIVLEWLSVP